MIPEARLQEIEYRPVREGEPVRCYMCFPVHAAEWVWTGPGRVGLCTKVFERLVAEGFAARAALTEESEEG